MRRKEEVGGKEGEGGGGGRREEEEEEEEEEEDKEEEEEEAEESWQYFHFDLRTIYQGTSDSVVRQRLGRQINKSMLNARAYDPRRKREQWALYDTDGDGRPKGWTLKRMRHVMGDGTLRHTPCSDGYYELRRAPPSFDVCTLFRALDDFG